MNITVVALVINPETPDTLYAGTLGGVFKSTNGGANWTAMNNRPPDSATCVHYRCLAINPQTPDTLYAGILGGVFKSTNGGESWTAMNNWPHEHQCLVPLP